MALLGHFKETADRKAAIEPGQVLRLDIVLVSGGTCVGGLVSIFDDGISVMDGNQISYIPLTGIARLSFDGPVFAPEPAPEPAPQA